MEKLAGLYRRQEKWDLPGGMPGSKNLGEVDIEALIAGRPQTLVRNREGRYRLFRIGDAVASRNIHAAILDSRRLCQYL